MLELSTKNLYLHFISHPRCFNIAGLASARASSLKNLAPQKISVGREKKDAIY